MLTQTALAQSPHSHRAPAALLHGKSAPHDRTSTFGLIGIAMSFGRNMEVYAEGETAGYVYKVVSGVVRISKLLPDGRRQISAFHMPGDLFGFEAGDLHHASAEAVVPTQVVAYKWESVLSAGAKSPGLVRELLNLAIAGMRQT